MRKIILLTFVSLDGIMQAPGGSKEDVEGDFPYGGWTYQYFDQKMGEVMGEQMSQPFDMLLGRKTYDLFASFWPTDDHKNDPGADVLNRATKYVVSAGNPKLDWDKSELITGDVIAKLKALKKETGPMLQVHGSSELIQTLLQNDLVDEIWLKIFPVTLGTGKRLFGDGTIAAAFKLTKTTVSPSGVICANYKRAGKLKTGSVV
ncbi:MAG TPA: dihydrofolate reductase family protein [Candidatus Saccharimonadales bacterium]|nr:dihydrofolate reductase family protein [Candidatus Saccharimonadales bacterium]